MNMKYSEIKKLMNILAAGSMGIGVFILIKLMIKATTILPLIRVILYAAIIIGGVLLIMTGHATFVFIRDEIIILLLKRRIYQSRVKPLNTLRLFVSLNEKTISTKMGIYRKKSTSARYALPNFFISPPPT